MFGWSRLSGKKTSTGMEIGFVGLGRMGGNMSLRLLEKGHRVIGFDLSQAAVQSYASKGTVPAQDWKDFVQKFQGKPRVMWIMVPAGDPTTQAINTLIELGDPGDIVVDGGNTNWKIALQDCARVGAKGMHYVDAGVSGGIWGLEFGYSLMVGAEPGVYEHIQPLLKDLAPDGGGLVHTGPEGSGHFVKMVHNGVEYGLMQAYAEGFQVMKMSKSFPGMDMYAIAEAWREGSVVRSWLLDLIARGLAQDPELAGIKGYVEDTGEGRWTVEAAIDESVPTPVIAESLFARFRSRMENTFGDRMLAMMRQQFGGHAVVKDASAEK
jgi:6-phosphogluconate dehydrogenase